MIRKILYIFAAAAIGVLGWSADAQTPAKKAPAKAVTKRPATAARNTAPATHTAASSRVVRKPAPRTSWRNRQTAPSPERYKEIQEALVTKGYLKPEQAMGSWDESSTEALKRFQADQNLESSGRINALSLIALGLGPKRDTTPPPTPPKPPVQ